MKKTQLYLLALVIAALATSAIVYKWQVLQFPLHADSQAEVWTLQARIAYVPERGANRVTLLVPGDTPGWSVLDERFVARRYSRLEDSGPEGREIEWSTRRAEGEQALYYRATVVRAVPAADPLLLLPEGPALIPHLDEPYGTAARAILDEVSEQSADVETFSRELVRRFHAGSDAEDVRLLDDMFESEHDKVAFVAGLLAIRNINARAVHGMQLDPEAGVGELRPWLAVQDEGRWLLVDPRDASSGWPPNFFLWSVTGKPIATVEGNDKATLEISGSRNMADAIAVAERRLEVRDADMVRFSCSGCRCRRSRPTRSC